MSEYQSLMRENKPITWPRIIEGMISARKCLVRISIKQRCCHPEELYNGNSDVLGWNVQNKITFQKTLKEDHRINLLIGTEVSSTKTENRGQKFMDTWQKEVKRGYKTDTNKGVGAYW